MVMKANQIKPSALLATVVLGDVSPLVTEEGRSVYEYLNGERTENIKGYATELVLTNQNFEKGSLRNSKHAKNLYGWKNYRACTG